MYEGGGRAGGGGGGGGDVRRRSGQETTKLMISNLDFGVTDADVKVGDSGMSCIGGKFSKREGVLFLW